MAKILIVDDEKDVVELLQFLLEKDGHEVLSANNGKDGLDLALKNRPDLMLLDVMMPLMDGYTVQTKLEEAPEGKSIPIIVLTAKGQLKDAFGKAPNVKAYLEKPFDPKALRAKIAESLGSSK